MAVISFGLAPHTWNALFIIGQCEYKSSQAMEMLDETERFEQGGLPRDPEILTPEMVALRALIDHLGEVA